MDYKTAGVDIESGDKASRAAYGNAKKTFASRDGLIGQPFELEGGFSGALDMGDFLLVQNDDGVGTKMEIAERVGKFDTLGADLVAMVADDAICVGAEVISLTNTVDTPSVNSEAIEKMTAGLAQSCSEQKIVVPGGEIAELSTALNGMVWNATAVGVVKKDKFITGKNVKMGQKIVGLKGRVLRSNGISLARKICEKNFGSDWHKAEWKDGVSWGEILLTPSKVFHRLILEQVLGDFESDRKFDVAGLVHITGGGIPGNVPRIFPEAGLGAHFDNLHEPHEAIKDLRVLGNIEESECYRTWHCGTAMMIVCDDSEADKICEVLNLADSEVNAKVVGEVTNIGKIEIISQFSGKLLDFSL